MPDEAPDAIQITEEFSRAFKALESGRRPVLITGAAGTGKSTLLREHCARTDSRAVVLAPTGVAALNVGGQTIHRFFQFGIDVTPDTIRTEKLRRMRRERRALYQGLDAVIIDEASMLRADLLDCIDQFLRRYGLARNQPFGGVHMAFIGDLYQLPPVVTHADRDVILERYASPHFFNAEALAGDLDIIELTRVFRQSDREFIDILHRARNAELTPGDLDALNTRVNPGFTPPEGESYITLTGTNQAAGRINARNLAGLPGEPSTAQASVSGKFTRESYPTDPELTFKPGAQIMLVNNDPKGRWVNGSLGVVESVRADGPGGAPGKVKVRLADTGQSVPVAPHTWETFEFSLEKDGRITSRTAGTFEQFPFRLAWAVTVHKSQGKTFDRMIIDLDHVFASGQTYVALSRCTALEGIVLQRPLRAADIRCDRKVKEHLSGASRPAPAGGGTFKDLFTGGLTEPGLTEPGPTEPRPTEPEPEPAP